MTPGDWWDQALCAQVGTDLFFPDKGQKHTDAKRVCARCDVQAQCLAYAMTQTDLYGVWGGQGALERFSNGAPYTRFASGLRAPCGTEAAYKRHQRNGTPPCQACREAAALACQLRKERRHAA